MVAGSERKLLGYAISRNVCLAPDPPARTREAAINSV